MSKIIKQNKPVTLNSREVAKMIGKIHKNILRDIETYIKQMEEANKELSSKVSPVDYFVKSNYKDASGKENPCYEITKMGCDFIAHKMKGVKGTAFTATYIKRFYELEKNLYKLPLSYPEALRQLADKAEQNEKLQIENNYKQDVINGLMEDVSLTDMRRLLVRVVRHKGANFRERWRKLYTQFEMKYHIESLDKKFQKYNECHKPKVLNKLDYVDKVINKIPELFEIACALYEDDIKELEKKMFNLREDKNLLVI